MATPVQYNCCLSKKKKFGHGHVQKKDDVKIQGGEGYLKAQERGLE